MSLAKYVFGVCLILIFQQSLAETDDVSEDDENELDEEFIEVLGLVEAEEDWFDIFLSTIDAAEKEGQFAEKYE